MTLEERQLNFIEKCKAKHPNENLDYSKVCYTNNRTHVIIIDHDLDENGESEYLLSNYNPKVTTYYKRCKAMNLFEYGATTRLSYSIGHTLKPP